MEIRSILVGASFAPSFVKALNLAKGVAEKFGARLYIYKAYQTSPRHFYASSGPFYTHGIEKEREELIEMLDGVINEETEGIGHRVEVIRATDEDPVKVLLRLAREKRADLLIIGHHEESDLEQLLFGRNLPRLIEEAPCYVMVAKSEPEAEEAGKALAA